MSDHDADPWSRHVPTFVDAHYGSITGLARTHVIDSHLAAHLEPAPNSILDIGGGAGNQSIPLARRGHRVTILDSSPAMLSKAADAIAREPHDVAMRITLTEGRGEDAGRDGEVFDVVCCHGVLLYLDDPDPMIEAIARSCRPGGMVSIVTKNRETLAVAPARRGEWDRALEAFDARSEVNSLGMTTRADTVDEITRRLETRGIDIVAWYGVRLFTDLWQGPEPADEDVAAILAVELEASRRDPYRRLSRLFHLIGRRRDET